MKLGVGMNKLDVSFGERERKITGIQLRIEPGPSNYSLTSNWKVLVRFLAGSLGYFFLSLSKTYILFA